MIYDKIRIDMEKELGADLYDLMQGEIVEEILKEAKIEKMENEWKFMLEGHSFKVTSQMAPRLDSLIKEVVNKLQFTEKIDFYITNNPELNAYSISRLEEDQAHIINLNSGLVERLDDDELKFVVGHEIGHLISQNAGIMKLLQFIFSDPLRTPLLITHKIALWEKLSELTADRFGFIASPRLDKCFSGFFKLASGLDTERIKFDYKAYMAENEKILDYFRKEMVADLLSHPINPIRIKAIELFSESELFKSMGEGADDLALREQISELIGILLSLNHSELDLNRRKFIAGAGLMIAGIDEEVSENEYEKIIMTLSNFAIFPKADFEEILKEGRAEEIATESARYILGKNPAERYPLFGYMVEMALSDRKISKKEVSFLYETGERFFGFSRKEMAQLIAEPIHRSFVPEIYL
jgi:uncharacterized tellurite resistance protein B-like protein/phage anti-repressor protein